MPTNVGGPAVGARRQRAGLGAVSSHQIPVLSPCEARGVGTADSRLTAEPRLSAAPGSDQIATTRRELRQTADGPSDSHNGKHRQPPTPFGSQIVGDHLGQGPHRRGKLRRRRRAR